MQIAVERRTASRGTDRGVRARLRRHRRGDGGGSASRTPAVSMPPLRIALGRLWQESNDLSTVPTTSDDWLANGVLRGDEIPALAGSHAAELGGFVDELREWQTAGVDVEMVPLAGTWCFPKGRLTTECFEWLQTEILEPLRKAVADEQGLDGVLLCLHGALVAEGENDAEGHLLAAVRNVIGPTVPLVATLDLHCHITSKMLDNSDALAVYHTYPHVDMWETGVRGAKILRAILQDGAKPVCALVRIPLVIPPERANTQATQEEIDADVYSDWPPQFLRRAKELEQEPWCLSVAVAMTQPWLRVDDFGSTVLVTAYNESSLAAAHLAARELATGFWDARQTFLPRGQSILPHAEAVAEAARHAQHSNGLVVIGDGADATTSGAPGDSTQLLKEVMQHDWPACALVALNSPSGVAAAKAVGVGATVTTAVGGVLDNVWCDPLEITGVVERTFRAKFVIQQDHMAGMKFDMGDGCTIALPGGTKLVLNSQHGAQFAGTHSSRPIWQVQCVWLYLSGMLSVCLCLLRVRPLAEFFALGLGIDPTDRNAIENTVFRSSLIVAKSPGGFRATYGRHAARMLSSEAPGCAPPRFWLPVSYNAILFHSVVQCIIMRGLATYPSFRRTQVD